MLNRLFLWGPPVLLMALIFTASSASDPGLPSNISDKVAHLGAYGLLGILLFRALAGGGLSGATPARAALALLFSVLYGVTDELHQSLVPNRSPDVMDLLADALGSGLGIAAILLLKWLRTALGSGRSLRAR